MANVPPETTQWAARLAESQQQATPARATRSSSRIASRSPGNPQTRVSTQSIWSQHDAAEMAAAKVKSELLETSQHQHQQHQQQHLGAATSSLAKFKAEQDLKIQTENLPQTPPAAGTSSTSSSTSTFPTPGTDTSSCATPETPETSETPAPPSSTGKKRRRRTAAQIDRKFGCNYPGCSKAYGSEGSLTQHQRLKHDGVILPKPMKGSASTQISSYFPPLHQTTRASGAAASASAPLTTTRTIRPATVEGLVMPVMAFEMTTPPGSGGLLLGAESAPSSAARPRQNQRSRSNSMPVSFPAPAAPVLTKHLSTSNCIGSTGNGGPPRPQTTRKSRVSCTPRAKSGAALATNRRGKCRSKSETLSDVHFFTAIGDESPLPPRSNRSASDSFMSSNPHEPFVVPAGLASSGGTSENVPMPSSTSSTLHHSHSFDWSSSMTSDSPASDQAIDSDILSVLADYDSSSDMDDSSTEFADGGLLSSGSFRSHAASFDESDDGDMLMTPVGLESYAFAPVPPPPTLATTGLRINDLFRRAEELGVGSRGVDLKTAFATPKHEVWPAPASSDSVGSADARLEAGYLSTHLEKMSMFQQQHQQQQQQLPASSTPRHLPATNLSGQMSGLDDFAGVSVDAFAVKAVSGDLEPESMEICEPDVKDEIFPLEILDDSVGVGGAAAVGGMWKSAGGATISSDVVAPSVALAPLDPDVLGEPRTTPKLEPADLQQHSQWTKSFASAASWAVLEAQNQYVDDLFQEVVARSPHEERKTHTLGAGVQFSVVHAHSLQSEKLAGHGQVASGSSLSDLLFGTVEYGLEDTRMGSPLLCQHEEL